MDIINDDITQSVSVRGIEMPDRSKTQYEQRWDAMSDLQKMQLQGLLEHYSNELNINY